MIGTFCAVRKTVEGILDRWSCRFQGCNEVDDRDCLDNGLASEVKKADWARDWHCSQ